MLQEFNSLIELVSKLNTEKKCLQYLEEVRWGKLPICVHCNSNKSTYIKTREIYSCSMCRKQFTVKVGTIFQGSRLPLQKWFMAIYLVTSHKKGISSCQLARDIGVTQKTAWFMLHRIRQAIKDNNDIDKLGGHIEIDETYVGGKESNKHASKRNSLARGEIGKIGVLGMQERQGNMYLKPLNKVDGWRIKLALNYYIEKADCLYTDESALYRAWKRKTVNHSKKVYANGEVYTNTIEGVFSHFKRCILGIYHHVSRKHINKYTELFNFRYNTRELGEGERFNLMLGMMNTRLQYSKLIT